MYYIILYVLLRGNPRKHALARVHTIALGVFSSVSLLSQQMSFAIKQKAHIYFTWHLFLATSRAHSGVIRLYACSALRSAVTLTATAFLLR